MPQANPQRINPMQAPQYQDICKSCAHTQAFHLTVREHSIEGFRKDCYAAGSKPSQFCGCPVFVSTWAQRRG